ncbi:MAG: 3-keto-5-aminohexanoate cleavage protein [Firmicutes bacterium]|nr:3-keto-5-aminohexanoate cleavage protein [Bacillota bacterium]
MDKRIITAALTGNWGDKTNNPALPMNPQEMAEAAYQCWQEGAAVVHIHMRDEEGKPTMRVDLFEETMRLIREKCDVIINMTSSGGHSLDGMAADETRLKPFEVLKPEMGSFDCGTLNWLHQTIFENSPKFLEQLGHLMQEVGTKPELEIFDVGMVDTAKHYIKTGVLKAPCHFQLVMNAAGGMAGTVENLVYLKNQLPEGSTWSATGISRSHMPILLATLALGGHVRVGLEDNVYYAHGVLAESNAQLVKRAANIIREAGYQVATPAEAREILGIPQLV